MNIYRRRRRVYYLYNILLLLLLLYALQCGFSNASVRFIRIYWIRVARVYIYNNARWHDS